MIQRATVMTALRRPASAAIAGIVFAVIFGTVLLLIQSATPVDAQEAGTWTDDEARRGTISAALNLLPFAGIAFLWFIGVIRAQVGSAEDRFIETVFMGSGLLFVAMLFTAASVLEAALILEDTSVALPPETRALTWTLATSLAGLFGARMAAVFTMSVATVGRRSGALPRWLTISGYVIALALLLTPPFPTFVQLLFPGWVLALSVYVLTGRGSRRLERS